MAQTIVLEGSEKAKNLAKLDHMLRELTEIDKDAMKACNEILINLNKNVKEFKSKIVKMKLSIVNAKKFIIEGQQISNEFIEIMNSGKYLSLGVNYERIIQEVKAMFSFDIVTNCDDEYMLYVSNKDPNLYEIDLNTQRKSIVANFSKFWLFGATCKIGKDEFFISGGAQNSPHCLYGNTSIINIKNKTETVLEATSPIVHHSCIFKDNIVYVFGGSNLEGAFNTTKSFNIKSKIWSTLPNLPIASQHISTTFIQDKLILTGYYFGCAYVFHQNSYLKNLDLPIGGYYMACDKWVIGNSCIYECVNVDRIIWNRYSITIRNIHASLYATFKRNKFIYFSLWGDEVWRIDTELKIAEKLSIC